jgi:hypothetical protein
MKRQEVGENCIMRSFITCTLLRAPCSTNGEKWNAYRTLVGKPEGKRQLVRPRRRWVDNIKMDLRGREWDGVDLIDMEQDGDQWRVLVNTVLNLRVP